MLSIGVDIGGTFTDFCLYSHDSGRLDVFKVLTTPGAPETAVLEGVEQLRSELAVDLADVARFVHATTLVTNAILERKGARTALITTAGFRDVLETGLEMRYNVYDLFLEYPAPVVPRWHRFGLSERVYSSGAVRTPIDHDQLDRIVSALEADGVQAVAVCLIHAYRNPEHEIAVAEYLRKRLPDVEISLSHQVSPQPREYERTSTTVLDAYVKPTVTRYLGRLQAGVGGAAGQAAFQVMLSNGGTTTTEVAQAFPIQMIESGPAAGVEAAIWICGQHGIDDALSFDMGGTTAKLCVLSGGRAARARSFEAGRVHRFIPGSGMPVIVPVYDLVEIGAGGGSIARVDNLGLVSVGPQSAGAQPGPACYGHGGSDPTVTDADLVMGYLAADAFLGGGMGLDLQAARSAIDEQLATPLGLSVEEAAHGICETVNEAMASAARLHIAEKGGDPSRLTVIAFGGAGPSHAVELARKLGCPKVLYPLHAGVMSSFGLLTAPPAFERMASLRTLASDCSPETLGPVLDRLRGEVAQTMGRPGAEVSFRFIAEMWHKGQEYPIEVDFAPEDLTPALGQILQERFRTRYAALYGRTDDELPLEVAIVRAIGSVSQEAITRFTPTLGAGGLSAGAREVYDPKTRAQRAIPVHPRPDLAAGTVIEGPAVIQDLDSATVMEAGDVARVLDSLAIEITLATADSGDRA